MLYHSDRATRLTAQSTILDFMTSDTKRDMAGVMWGGRQHLAFTAEGQLKGETLSLLGGRIRAGVAGSTSCRCRAADRLTAPQHAAWPCDTGVSEPHRALLVKSTDVHPAGPHQFPASNSDSQCLLVRT